MSRIFQAIQESEKAGGKSAPGPATGNGGQLPDLMASLESWSAGLEGPSAGKLQSAPRTSANVSPRAGVLGALGDLDNSQKTVEQPVEPGEPWQELAARNLKRPEIHERAEHVICQPRPEERVLTSGQFPTSAQESFRVLCQRLLQVRKQRRLQSLLITSPVTQEGKTVTAINLAATLARSSPAVLLVDADLRHPKLPVLGIAPGSGLADYLAGRIELTKAIRRVDPLGFYYLPAGFAITNPSELLQKPALQEFINQAAAAFDWVIFDSSSINLFADPRHLAMLVDGVLLVVRENMTPKELPEKSLVALEKAFVVGLVLNASTGSPYAHYDLSERSRAVEKDETASAPKQLKGKPVSNDSIVPRLFSDQGGRRS